MIPDPRGPGLLEELAAALALVIAAAHAGAELVRFIQSRRRRKP